MMGPSYPHFTYSGLITRVISSVHVTFGGGWKQYRIYSNKRRGVIKFFPHAYQLRRLIECGAH